jgi:hypothetical protein
MGRRSYRHAAMAAGVLLTNIIRDHVSTGMLKAPAFLDPRASFTPRQRSVRIGVTAQQVDLLKHHHIGGLECYLFRLVPFFRLHSDCRKKLV